ncbi:ATP-binding cassette subfamily B protein [Sinobaca qinghaiensis]|uniref:ATP-binding cassette subfamily B protein n=1 Tax=Sinobaca qinghaiensis TaxID=342944 RepID=A0A419UWF7_9BACL|nr:ABC transporter ATP-binding protein [Sinobaca qinghaiensis]RKD69461.1 ATP-binding cassette subfamily B protein [Sinobaca qinghaiensis]
MIRRFAQYYKPYKKLFFFTLASGVLAALFELAFPLAVNRIIDDLLPNENWDWIIWGSAALFILYVLNGGFHYVIAYWGHMLGINIETDMRRELFERLQQQPLSYYDETKTGHLISRLTNDLMDIGEVAHHGPEEFIVAFMTLIGAFTIMLTIDWRLAVMTFILVPVFIALTYVLGKKMAYAMSSMFTSIGNFNARVENNITGIRVVKAFANEKFEMERFAEDNGRFRATKLESYKIMALHVTSSQIMMKFLLLFVLIAGTWSILNNRITNGEFVAFVLLTNVMIKPIQQLNAVMEMYPKGIAGFRRYLDLMDATETDPSAPTGKTVEQVNGDIRYEDVSFSYNSQTPVLQNINASIPAGTTAAFIGPSGSGKTTISNLLPRFYELNGGQITIDGMDIQEMDMVSLRSHIGIVQQDVFLFDGTIRDNIAYGRLDAPDEEILEAVERAQLTDVVAALPEGLDTKIGERGVKLSGGQKQRLSIARMFLKNPAILILDEATSALDTETEALIQAALEELSEGRTTIIIAHRLATIKQADAIFVMTKEGIVERGSHGELMAENGLYTRLYQSQFPFEYA